MNLIQKLKEWARLNIVTRDLRYDSYPCKTDVLIDAFGIICLKGRISAEFEDGAFVDVFPKVEGAEWWSRDNTKYPAEEGAIVLTSKLPVANPYETNGVIISLTVPNDEVEVNQASARALLESLKHDLAALTLVNYNDEGGYRFYFRQEMFASYSVLLRPFLRGEFDRQKSYRPRTLNGVRLESSIDEPIYFF